MISEAVLPKGLDQAAFARAVAEYRAIVGDEHVIVELERLAPYTKIMIPEDEGLHQPSGVIAPDGVEQIRQILAVSTKYKIPLWTVSTGRNFGYGSASPATPGQMVLDLRRMNRIISVDPDLCTVLVEPGVTYRQLQDYLEANNYDMWLNFPSPGPIVGPVGNTLDHGMGWNRYAENMSHFCGMEVMLADGSLIQTGMGGIKGGNTWQCYRWGFGPWTDGLFTQSNLGVVTKMGFWLMPKPAASRPIGVGFNTPEAAAKGMDVLRRLRMQSVIETMVLGETTYDIAVGVKRSDIYQGEGAIPPDVLDKFRRKLGVPHFAAALTLYGTTEQIDVNENILRKSFEGIGDVVTLDPNGKLPHIYRNQTGMLNLDEFGIYNFRGGGGSAWFAVVIPFSGAEYIKSINLCRPIFEEFGFDYMGGVNFGPLARHAEHVMDLLFDRANPEEMRRAYACFDKLLSVNIAAGYAPYRVNTAFMNKTAEAYGPAQRDLNRRLKNALDPHGILAPGKSGIFN